MKIGSSVLQFHPRELTATRPSPVGRGTEDSSSLAQKQQEELLQENPFLPRSLDCAHAGQEAFAVWTRFNSSPLGRVTAGGIAVGAGVWGLNKLIRGETLLDRVDGIGTLAMAAEKAMDASGGQYGGATTAVGLIHGGADLITGVADIVRGNREDNKRRLWAGAFQVAIGASVTAMALMPASATISTVVMGAAAVGRQIAIGAHWQLPKKSSEPQPA